MDVTEAARREAERLHRANVVAGGDPTRPLVCALREATSRGLDVYALQEGDSQLKGGKATFDSQAGGILYEDRGSDFERAFLIAHELGHVVLEGGTLDAVTVDVESDRSMEDAPVSVDRVLDYGARERREVKMDLFAREAAAVCLRQAGRWSCSQSLQVHRPDRPTPCSSGNGALASRLDIDRHAARHHMARASAMDRYPGQPL